jgi:hypothetical protein
VMFCIHAKNNESNNKTIQNGIRPFRV